MSQDKKILDISKIREDNKSEVYLSWFFEDYHSFLISYPTTYSLENVKNNIFKCGCISIKFTQWIISKLKGFDNKTKYKYIIDEFENIFDN